LRRRKPVSAKQKSDARVERELFEVGYELAKSEVVKIEKCIAVFFLTV
jgi:hypothetical protein